ncbi:hypothetical protein FGF1_14150 [Flavobacteriaceae bacterium GF1]
MKNLKLNVVSLSILTVVCVLSIGCKNSNFEPLNNRISELEKKNDSLKLLLDKVNQKYVFDSIKIRHIPYCKNSNRVNSIYREEIVFAAYNVNGGSLVIIGDSLNFDNGLNVINGDTLELKNGAFQNSIELNEELNRYKGILETQNEFGKPFIRTISLIVRAKDQ